MSTPSTPPNRESGHGRWERNRSPGTAIPDTYGVPLEENNTVAEHPTPRSTGSGKLQQARSGLGLKPSAPIDEDHDAHERQQLLWSRIRVALREPFLEFWGVFILVMFGDGSIAQVLLSTGNKAPGGMGFGQYQSISWG